MEDKTAEPLISNDDVGEAREVQKIVLPGQTPEGEYILGVLVKRSYDIVPGKPCARSEADGKLIPGDVPYDDPMNSPIKFETDFIPFKVATDVVLNGNACAPGGRPVQELTASVIVAGQFRKDIRVIGDRRCASRRWRNITFTDPEPFTTMEIRYERAYGGVDIYSDLSIAYAYPRNHLGRGFAIEKNTKVVDNLVLPNMEDPDDLLTPERIFIGDFKSWENQPMPQGFGWFGKSWQPRASLAGVMPGDRAAEQELLEAYALAIPPEQKELSEQTKLPDMDFRFFNGASEGLALPFLSGDEGINLINLDPEGDLSFQLPGEGPGIGLDIGMGVQEPEVFLHTVMIRMDDRQVDLVWRGAVTYPGPDWLPEMKKMEVLIQ